MNLFELFVKIGVDDQASDKISNLSSKFGNGLKTAAKVGTAAVAAVGSGIAALGTYAAKVGSDFEAQMSKVSAISGATGDDLQALEDKAKQLGIDTKFSATEAGQAFEYMAMAGWKTEQMLDGVAGIMDLAAASGEDLASVSDIVTDAMTAFGLSAENSTHFADVLAKASSNANTNVGLMGETFKYVAPVAGAMGFSVEDTATAIGLMANAGIKGSQAGTALRSMFSRLAKPTDEVATAMETLNLSITNSDGSMRELDDIMADLRKGFDGLTEAEQTQIAAQLAGQEAMSGLLAIVNTSEDEYNKLADAINNADGAAKEMADTMANNLQGQLTLLKSSAEGFGLALYEKIKVPLTEMASWAVESLNELTTAFNEKGVDGVVEAVGNILSEAITTVVDKLPDFVDLAVSVIESFVNGLLENQKTIASGAISIITTLANGLLNMLPEIVALGLDLIISLANGIAESLPELIPVIVDVVLQIVDILTSPDTLNSLIGAALEIMLGLAEGLIKAIPDIVEAIPTIIENLIQAIIDAIPQIIDAGIQLFVALVENLPAIIAGIVKAIPEIIMAILDGLASLGGQLADLFSKAWEGIKNVFSGVGDWFKEKFTEGKEKANEAWSNAKELFSKNWENVKAGYALVGDWFEKTFKEGKERANKAWSNAKELFSKNWENVKAGYGAVGDWFSKTFKEGKDGAVNAWSNVKETFSGIWDKIKEIFSKGSDIGENIISGIKNGISNAWGNLKDWFSGLFDDLIGGAKKILGIASPSKVFKKIGGFTAEGFGQGWNDAFGEIKKSITKDLDFGEAKIGVSTNASRNLQGTTQGYHNASNDYPMTIIVQSVLDGKVIGETAYKYARGQHRSLGVV